MSDEVSTMMQINIANLATLAGLVAVGGYFLLFRKKKKTSAFDAELISTFSIADTVRRMSRSQSVCESGFIGKLQATNTNVAVFYGSQTGTAEEFSCRLAKDAKRYGMKGKAIDPEECDMSKLSMFPDMVPNGLAIFCLATYGEGDPTDNTKEFFEMLENPDVSFEGLRFAVFALGNRTYEHFNAAGIYVDKRLKELGAKSICEVGMGDDDTNIEEHFVTWKETMWAAVCKEYGVEAAAEITNQRQFTSVIQEPGAIEPEKLFKGEVTKLGASINKQNPPFDVKNPFCAKVTVNRNLYKGERVCMHLEVDIAGSKIRYETGDHLAVYCRSDKTLVDKIGELLGVDLEAIITMTNVDPESSKKTPFPCPTTYRTALSYYVDINQCPTTYVLKEFVDYATDEADKDFLKKLTAYTDEGKEMYSNWVLKSNRNIVHILEDLKSVKPAMDHLLELLPRLQPRFYSISSSPKVHPESVHITAVLVEYETSTKRQVKGVCTNFLNANLGNNNNESDQIIMCYVRKSQFRLPAKPESPMIMIGPGTGLAPFRGFLQERDWMRKEGRSVGDNILYFSCRKKSEDYLYEEELNQFKNDGTLTQLRVAFSRDQADKVYVTHLLKQNKEELWDVIGKRNGNIYVCGDAKSMARNVKDIILEVIQEVGGKTKSEAEAFFKKMESSRKYAADVWS